MVGARDLHKSLDDAIFLFFLLASAPAAAGRKLVEEASKNKVELIFTDNFSASDQGNSGNLDSDLRKAVANLTNKFCSGNHRLCDVQSFNFPHDAIFSRDDVSVTPRADSDLTVDVWIVYPENVTRYYGAADPTNNVLPKSILIDIISENVNVLELELRLRLSSIDGKSVAGREEDDRAILNYVIIPTAVASFLLLLSLVFILPYCQKVRERKERTDIFLENTKKYRKSSTPPEANSQQNGSQRKISPLQPVGAQLNETTEQPQEKGGESSTSPQPERETAIFETPPAAAAAGQTEIDLQEEQPEERKSSTDLPNGRNSAASVPERASRNEDDSPQVVASNGVQEDPPEIITTAPSHQDLEELVDEQMVNVAQQLAAVKKKKLVSVRRKLQNQNSAEVLETP